jgi:hypothetical protein
MTTKATAVLVQLATTDSAAKQQMVVFANKAVYRRSLTDGTRTRWRYASVGDLPTWVEGYVNLTKAAPTPMDVSHGPTLMEVTEDEVSEADGGSFPRNVGLRFTRVLDAIDADPTSVVTTTSVRTFMDDWVEAQSRDDNAWIDKHIHPAGTAKAPTPAADPDPAPAEPEAPVVAAISHGWTYPETKGGYITRSTAHSAPIW